MPGENPSDAEAWSRLGGIKYAQGDIEDALSSLRRANGLEPTPNRHSRLLQCLQYSEKVSPTEILTAHNEWNTLYAAPHNPKSQIANLKSSSPLRLGFLSANFGTNPTAFLVLPALQALDKSRCTVVCYSDRASPDEYTEKFRLASQLWRPTSQMPDEQLANQIKNDEIDIIFDLMGHSGKRLLVFARRPAPLQLTWLGYVGTTGLAAMDYLLADQYHVRPGEEANHREEVLRLPHDYICYAPPADAPEVSPLPALANGHITFGCFNNPAKYSASTLDAWAEILRRVPTSHLLLKFGGLHHPEVQSAIRKKLDARRVDQMHVHFEGWSPQRELLAAYNRVDIALDTQPYSGGVTTCEALWMGVPVITFPGATFASRHSTSHLTNASCADFIATDWPTYINFACDWATRQNELATLRASLRPRMQASSLCNAPLFASNFLTLLEHEFAARAV